MKKLYQLLRDNAAKERQPIELIRNEATGEATLWIYDVIDQYWGVNALDVAKLLASLDPALTLRTRINSPGGDVFEARGIVTAIQDFAGKKIAQVDGLAASCSSWIATAHDEVVIADGAFFMIHNAFGGCYGNKADMLQMGALLGQVDNSIVQQYAKDTGKTPEQIQQWMDAETWFTAQEAIDNGFADAIKAPASAPPENLARRTWNLAAFDKTPAALLTPPAPKVANDIDIAAALAHNERRLQLYQFA
jgi:ATP-dependent Clp protease protease subunit